jgi:hypothetical protein
MLKGINNQRISSLDRIMFPTFQGKFSKKLLSEYIAVLKAIHQHIISILIPLGVYLVLSTLLKNWIVDDAGISFAYAKNLANGVGLTTWPGEPPVEGFSNFFWTLILSFFHWIHLFDPTLTPKIISITLVFLLFIFNHQLSKKITQSFIPGLFANLLIACNAPFIIWTNSGLENALYVFLMIGLLLQIIQFFEKPKTSSLIGASILTFLIAITRPEGIIYAAIFPICWMLKKQSIKYLLTYVGLVSILFGSFLIFRYFYFNDWLPNTYYIKYHHSTVDASLWDKIEYFTYAIGGRWARWLIILNLIFSIYIALKLKTNKTSYLTLLVTYLITILNFFILPNDWMHELRFATPFIVITYIVLGSNVYLFLEKYIVSHPAIKIVATFFSISFIGYSAYHFHIRLNDFRKDPTLSFAQVKQRFADPFNDCNKQLQLKDATILLPDAGASLYYLNMQVYDAVGLCDKNIRIKRNEGPESLRNYIFNELQPTFIHLHGKWAELYNIYEDPRLDQYYVPLSYPHLNKMMEEEYEGEFNPNKPMNFIRKDAITGKNQIAFEQLH